MANIDSLDEIKRLDADNLLQNIQEFPEQVERCWSEWSQLALPARFIQAKSVLICGMGGSAINGEIAASLAQGAKIPIISWRDYRLPGWVNKDTLVIISSYSGNTEEPLNALKYAASKTDKIISFSSGGELESLSRKYKTFHYKINYGAQPRAAFGYLFMTIIAIFKKLDLLELSDEDVKEALVLLKGLQKKIDANIPTGYNNAKLLAKKIEGFIPVVYGSGILAGVARRWKQDLNEDAKSASYFEVIPELNHNALAGFEFPKDLKSKIFVIVLQSKFDHPRNRLRGNITLQILQQRRIACDSVICEPSPTPLAEILQAVHLGDYVSYYLAILNDIEPNPIEIIKFLREKLAEKPVEEKWVLSRRLKAVKSWILAV